MSVLHEKINGICQMCGWEGSVEQLVDYDPKRGLLDSILPEYCPSCHSPYVVYDVWTMEWNYVDRTKR